MRWCFPWLCGLLVCLGHFGRGDDVGNLDEGQPVAGDYIPLTCWNFTVGDWKHREFYSPQYPDDYSNSTECMQLLIAPKGYRIRLDFRDEFHIEYSDGCKYDFLELRDGPFGYSQLLGRYCGKEHPPITESSSRFLWIRFKSDDSIEYKGFRAVFDFFQPDEEAKQPESKPVQSQGHNTNNDLDYEIAEDEVCRIEVPINNGEGVLDSQFIADSQLHNDSSGDVLKMIDCTYVIYAPPKHRVYLRWPEYAMTTPQNCADSFLEIYERTTALSDRRKQLCGGMAREFKSTSNHVYIRVFAQSANLVPLFKALLTVYTPGPCAEDKFDCGDDTCIDPGLVCDGEVNCNYNWDEMNCKAEPGAVQPESTEEPLIVKYHTIIISVVGGSIFIIVFLSICITCHHRKREEKRRCHALKQDERRALEMTTLINKSQATPQHVANQHNKHNKHNGPPPPTQQQLQNHHHNTLPLVRNVNGHHKNSIGGNHRAGCNSHGEYLDGSDLDLGRDGQYRRYLEVNHYPEDEYLSHTLPHNHTQIPAVVTIEKPPRSRDDWKRDQTPSPRPDVVQEEKFLYPPDTQDSSASRRLSVDTVKSDKSDIWKPMDTGTHYKTLDHKPRFSDAAKDHGTRTLPRVNFNLDNLEPKYRDVVHTDSNGKFGTHPNHHSNPNNHGLQPVYSEDPYINRTVCIPPPPGTSTVYRTASTNSPQSTGYHTLPHSTNAPQVSATVYHNHPPSTNSPQSKHPPPKPPQRSPHTELQSSGGKTSPAPDMFYTRPKRTVTNPQAKHAAV